MEDKVNTLHGWAQAACVSDIPAHNLDALRREPSSILYWQDQRPNMRAALLQLFYKMASKQASSTRY